MSLFRAILALPLSPSAARALEGRPAALLVAIAPAGAVVAYLVARGCDVEDAVVAGTALLLAEVFAGLGGAVALAAAARVAGAGRSWRRLLPGCVAFAAWCAVMMAAFTATLSMLGAGSASALLAAVALLAWGVAWGAGGILARGGGDPGRALVASCAGAAGAIAGLALAATVARAQLVALGPAGSGGPDGDIPLSTLVLKRPGPSGGRLFFRFGGPWGGAAVGERASRAGAELSRIGREMSPGALARRVAFRV